MEIDDVANRQNEKLIYCYINRNEFFILAVSHLNNFHPKDNDSDYIDIALKN